MPHVKQISEVRRVYLIGIGGTAMASLAGMLQKRGYVVGGSDEHVYPPMSTYLQTLGIPVLEGYTRQHLETFRPDLVVIGNVAAKSNPEAEATLAMDLPYTSMPEAIYELFIKGDEYNTAFFDKGPKFLHYAANALIVNNIEFDHADIYADLNAIIDAFRKAALQVAP